jgi:sphingomyelin phosphodiesterase
MVRLLCVTLALAFQATFAWALGDATAQIQPKPVHLTSATGPLPPLRVWHLTDVHVDPYYVPGAKTQSNCYCETKLSCPRMGAKCGMANATDPTDFSAGIFGNSEGNCASPKSLFESALEFMAAEAEKPELGGDASKLVYLTGDYAEAGVTAACETGLRDQIPEARQQLLDIMAYDRSAIRKLLPDAKVMSSLGNHDCIPGDVATGTLGEQWKYANLTALWAADLGSDGPRGALATVKKGGYFSTSPRPGLRILSLNTNYFGVTNAKLLKDPGSAARQLQEAQLSWFEAELEAAESAGEAVHVLGHIPPVSGSDAFGDASRKMLEEVMGWRLSDSEVKTPGWMPGLYERYAGLIDRFRGTVKAQIFGHTHVDWWTLTRACPDPSPAAPSPAPPSPCAGEPTGVIVPGPAMTEGYPARNPSVRLLEFDPETYALVDARTYVANLHEANRTGKMEWSLEEGKSFRAIFGMESMSPASFQALHERMRKEGSAEWDLWKGRGDGSLYCSGYDASTARKGEVPLGPCKTCEGGCKTQWIDLLDGR